ncbi:MAG: MmgE/PrpD family protein [Minwuia sp.]|nr:MmgE/PrpD family protein [Minwuia sp.]
MSEARNMTPDAANAPLGLTTQLAQWCAQSRAEDLPHEVLADTKLRLLDTLGLVLGAADTPIGRAVRAAALEMGSGSDAFSLGTGDCLPAGLAALIDGTLAHAADFDDTHDLSVVHPSAAIVPMALALGQARKLTGLQILHAIAIGNEVNCRIGSGAPGGFHRHGFHPTSVVGTLAVAITATVLTGGTAAQAVHAAGIAGSQAAGLMEAFADGTWSKTLHPGWACHAGMAAANLAKAGFTGPASILEGRFGLYHSHVQDPDYPFDLDTVTDGLGMRWTMLDCSFKPYPCAHAIHPFVDAALAIHGKIEGSTADVTAIRALVGTTYQPLICEPMDAKRVPLTPTHARASLPYAVSVALHRGALGPGDYSEEVIGDPTVLSLAEHFTYATDTVKAPAGFRGVLEVTMSDGVVHRHVEPVNRGSRTNPMPSSEMIGKFRLGAARHDRGRQNAIIEAIDHLEDAASINGLVRACL